MNRDETHCCGEMDQHLSCGELGIVYWPKFREYGLRYLDGGDSIQVILHCPWCGMRLPGSLRDQWFDRVDALGLDPDDPELPEELRTDAWWRTTH